MLLGVICRNFMLLDKFRLARVFKGSSSHDIETKVNAGLKQVSDRYSSNGLSMNVDNTNFMLFRSKHDRNPYQDICLNIGEGKFHKSKNLNKLVYTWTAP